MNVDLILKFFGFKDFIYNEKVSTNTNIEIHIDENNDIFKKSSENILYSYLKYYFLFFVNKIYFSLIMLFFSWKIIYVIVFSIINKDINIITKNLFIFLPPFQLYYGYSYYQSRHFIYSINKKKSYKKILYLFYIISPILSFIMTLCGVILLNLNFNINIYSNLWNYGLWAKIIFSIIFIFDKFYSYNIILINCFSFIYIFFLHVHEIKTFSENLDKFINNDSTFTLQGLSQEYINIKYDYRASVNKFNNIFSSATLIGILYCFFLTENFDVNNNDYIQYLNVIIFFVIEFFYIFSISKIKEKKGDIITIINSNIVIDNFLTRTNFNNLNIDFDKNISKINDDISYKKTNSKNNDINIRSMITDLENAKSIDWIILNTLLKGGWKNFSILGYDIDDSTLFKKILGIVIGFLMILNINTLFN